ncbi:MAG: hypothetical protein S4CHLAM123_06520 [Chlamydiales bacterium]|nr:hypothetical protein [Chlamydiales bacterium]
MSYLDSISYKDSPFIDGIISKLSYSELKGLKYINPNAATRIEEVLAKRRLLWETVIALPKTPYSSAQQRRRINNYTLRLLENQITPDNIFLYLREKTDKLQALSNFLSSTDYGKPIKEFYRLSLKKKAILLSMSDKKLSEGDLNQINSCLQQNPLGKIILTNISTDKEHLLQFYKNPRVKLTKACATLSPLKRVTTIALFEIMRITLIILLLAPGIGTGLGFYFLTASTFLGVVFGVFGVFWGIVLAAEIIDTKDLKMNFLRTPFFSDKNSLTMALGCHKAKKLFATVAKSGSH